MRSLKIRSSTKALLFVPAGMEFMDIMNQEYLGNHKPLTCDFCIIADCHDNNHPVEHTKVSILKGLYD